MCCVYAFIKLQSLQNNNKKKTRPARLVIAIYFVQVEVTDHAIYINVGNKNVEMCVL